MVRVHVISPLKAGEAAFNASKETPPAPTAVKRPSQFAPLTLYRQLSSVSTTASYTALTAIITEELSKIPSSFRTTLGFVARTLGLLMRNALASSCCAWLITLCFSWGNIFSGKRVDQQSATVFLISVLMWTKLFNWISVSACFAVRLQPHQCIKSSKLRSGLMFWWFKVALESLAIVIVTTVVMLTIAIGSTNASQQRASWVSKLVFFLSTILQHCDTTACSVASARLFREETVQGRGRSQTARPRSPYLKRFLRDIRGSILNLLSFQIAAVYAYVTFSLDVSSTLRIAAFMTGSIALKITMQEAAKHIIFKQKVHSVAIMAALIGTPTILIHTHMSIMMLRLRHLNTTISGTLSTAILEIIMRVGKALLIKRQICQEARRRTVLLVNEQGAKGEDLNVAQEALTAPKLSPCDAIQDKLEHDLAFVTWRTRLLHYYAAEVYVDMFAEYVAMGCSYAILVLFWDHPMFRLGYGSDDDEATATHALSQTLFRNARIPALILQVGIEIVVDYVACVLETMQGINMQPLHAHNVYLIFFLVWAAVGNITIASHVFFRPAP